MVFYYQRLIFFSVSNFSLYKKEYKKCVLPEEKVFNLNFFLPHVLVVVKYSKRRCQEEIVGGIIASILKTVESTLFAVSLNNQKVCL